MYYVYVPTTKGELRDAILHAGRFRDDAPNPWEEGEAQAAFSGIMQSLIKRYGRNGKLTMQFQEALLTRESECSNNFVWQLNEIVDEIGKLP